MNVQQAVEQRENPAKPSVSDVVNRAIAAQMPRIQPVLPRGFDAERFGNVVLTAVKGKPDLLECFATEQGKVSLLLAVMQAATIGLEPDTPLQEAWLLPRRNQGTMEAQLSIGYRGLLKLVRRSGQVREVYAHVVRANDDFDYQLGLNRDLHHVPAVGDRGDLTHAYAVIRYTDGGIDFVVLDRHDVEQRRASSDSWRNERARPYSPWTVWPEAMWAKSALRALLRYAPLSGDVMHALNSDERVLTITDTGGFAPRDDDTPHPAELDPAPPEPAEAAGDTDDTDDEGRPFE